MSQENVEFGCRRLGRWNRRRVSVSAAALVGLACGLLAAGPAGAVAGAVFQQVTVVPNDARLVSDGARFVKIRRFGSGAPWVFDMLVGRSFQPMPPIPDCQYAGDGGGVVLWECISTGRYMLTDLATGAAREPAGWAAIEAMKGPHTGYSASRVGRHWLEVECGFFPLGPQADPIYLNHRTGQLVEETGLTYVRDPRIDLNYVDLVRRRCPPLQRARLDIYLPPFALEGSLNARDQFDELRLRRCGEKRAELLSHCRSGGCVAARLGSRYVTWAEDERVFAYLPRIRRRVLVGRAPAQLHGPGGGRSTSSTPATASSPDGRSGSTSRTSSRAQAHRPARHATDPAPSGSAASGPPVPGATAPSKKPSKPWGCGSRPFPVFEELGGARGSRPKPFPAARTAKNPLFP